MSGQLVGEVIAASAALQKRGLSQRGFHALIAIAEKCHTQTRQGSVRWDHICDCIYGASLSTAQRAVKDLKSAGAIRVVKRGFNNQHGRICAPIYQIEPLGDTSSGVSCESVSATTEHVTQVTQSPPVRTGHPGDAIGGGRTCQTRGRTRQIGGRTGHPGDLLDGPLDGPLDGGSSPQSGTALDEPQPSTKTHPSIASPNKNTTTQSHRSSAHATRRAPPTTAAPAALHAARTTPGRDAASTS